TQLLRPRGRRVTGEMLAGLTGRPVECSADPAETPGVLRPAADPRSRRTCQTPRTPAGQHPAHFPAA
ncbi:hypothetical protein ACFWIZ_31310, partial [Streptomyces sp. NPDC127044]